MDENCCTCCICFEKIEDDYITTCCQNKIHKYCLIEWFISKGQNICPLCKKLDINITINDLLTHPFKRTDVLHKKTFIENINKLIKQSNQSNDFIIKIEDSFQTMEIDRENVQSSNKYYCPSLVFICFVLFTVSFYLFNIIDELKYQNNKNNQTILNNTLF